MVQDISKIIAEYALSSEANLETAYETKNAFPMILNSISNNFVNILTDKLKEQDNSIWQIENNTSNERINVYFSKNSWPHRTKIGFLDYDRDRLFFSVEISEDNRDVLHSKLKLLNNEGSVNDARYWFRLRNPYNRWEETYEVMINMTIFGDLDSSVGYFINLLISNSIVIDEFLKLNCK